MAKVKKDGGAALNRAAETIGRTLGSAAATVDSFQAQHPNPVDEVRDAWVTGQGTLTAAASKAGRRGAAVVKKVKAVVRRTKKTAATARKKSAPSVRRVTLKVRKALTGAKRAIKGGRKAQSTAKRPKR
jgi:hypothetical protein